jgi:hypothetical protein
MAMIDQFSQEIGTVGDLLLGIQKSLYAQGEGTLAEMAQGNPHAEQLAKAVPQREQDGLFISGKLRREALMYNLLGDPACEMKLHQARQ